MGHQIRRHGGALLAIVLLVVLSTAAGIYILFQERLPNPFATTYHVSADFASANGIVPGLGAPVNVAGVKVGAISGVSLVDGHARVTLDVDPSKLRRVYANAFAQLVPNTPLKDMQIELSPGGAPAPPLDARGVIPVDHTLAPIDADQLLAALDSDTRLWLQSAIAGLDQGTAGRTADLRTVLSDLGPTTEGLHRLGGALVRRRTQIARLVHNLRLLTEAAGTRDRQLGQVVANGNATVAVLAAQDTALGEAVRQLPGTLAAARGTLDHVTTFAAALGPTLTGLQPAARLAPGAIRAAGPLLDRTEPFLRTELRPFVAAAMPLVAQLRPTANALTAATPPLTHAFTTLRYVVNELAYNPPGDDEGLLFWLAWFAHNADSTLSTGDANGAVFRGLAVFSCSSLTAATGVSPLLTSLLGQISGCGRAAGSAG